MVSTRKVERKRAAHFAPRDAGRDLALAATLVVFGVFPIGVVCGMMLLQIFGVWSP
jgi:hypothetical protein